MLPTRVLLTEVTPELVSYFHLMYCHIGSGGCCDICNPREPSAGCLVGDSIIAIKAQPPKGHPQAKCNACCTGPPVTTGSLRFAQHTLVSRQVGTSLLNHEKVGACEERILGKSRGERLLSFEALFKHKIKPTLNLKDEYKSRTLKLKF